MYSTIIYKDERPISIIKILNGIIIEKSNENFTKMIKLSSIKKSKHIKESYFYIKKINNLTQ